MTSFEGFFVLGHSKLFMLMSMPKKPILQLFGLIRKRLHIIQSIKLS